jgi:hypothetical protein
MPPASVHFTVLDTFKVAINPRPFLLGSGYNLEPMWQKGLEMLLARRPSELDSLPYQLKKEEEPVAINT